MYNTYIYTINIHAEIFLDEQRNKIEKKLLSEYLILLLLVSIVTGELTEL